MKRFNPYKRVPYDCAWCHSNNTHIIDRPNIDPRESSKYNDEFYINRDPSRNKHHQIDDGPFGSANYKFNQDNEYINDRDRIPRLPPDERDEIHDIPFAEAELRMDDDTEIESVDILDDILPMEADETL